MRKILFILLLIPFFSVAQSDTTKYNKSANYGEIFRRVKPYNLLLPTDTINFKYGFGAIGTTTYIGNGTYWSATSGGGGGSVDSLTYARWLRLYKVNDSMKVVNDARYLLPSQTGNAGKYLKTNGTTASWGLPNFGDSVDYTGAGTGMYLRINPGGSGSKKYDFANVGGINNLTGLSPVIITGSGSSRDVAIDTSHSDYGLLTRGRFTNINAANLTISSANSTFQRLDNLQSDLTASSTKYPSINAVNTGLATKQGTITLTTTGTSGAATLTGNTLNIPEYQGGVTSFNSRTGAITPASGDYAFNQISGDMVVPSSTATNLSIFMTGELFRYKSSTGVNYIAATTSDLAAKLDKADSTNYALRTPDANVQAASYTLVLSDAGKFVEINNASANTLTIPPNSSVAFPIGTIVYYVQRGAGITTFTAGSGVTLTSNNSWFKSGGQTGYCGLRKTATNTWDLFGNIMP